ncbi:MAG: T9SS type A sorting domain-containing protein [Bacteroidia bacterium]
MKKATILFILFLFVGLQSRAACTYSSNTTISAATFVACGSITVNANVKLVVTGTVSINGGTTLNIVNSGTIEITGDFDASGNSTVNYSGSGVFIVDGSMTFSGSLNMSTSGSMVVMGDASFGGSATVSGTGNIDVAGTATSSGSSTVFGWSGGSCTDCVFSTSNPTPITLLSFTAVLNKNQVEIKWTSATELNNKYYSLERSSDGRNFKEIQRINSKATNGNSLVNISYETIDEKPVNGISYYRLRQTDYNGKNEAFKAVSVLNGPPKDIIFSVSPNPNNGEFTANFTGVDKDHEIQLLLHDELGRIVYSNTFVTEEAMSSVNVSPSQNVGKGFYFCTLIVDGVKQTVKVVVR